MIRIYDEYTTNFNSNGLGVLNSVIEAYVYETLNGAYYMTLKYPNNAYLSEYLREGNIIKCNISANDYQLFRINTIERNIREINVTAYHIFYDLGKNMLLNVAPTELTCQNFGQWLLARTNYATTFTFSSNISGTKSARYIRKTPVDAIMGEDENSMLKLFGGELVRDNFSITLNANRGANRGVKIMYGKNITSINYSLDITNMVTRVLPKAYDGVMLPEVYVDSQYIGNYPTPKIAMVEMEDIIYDPEGNIENSYNTLEATYTAMRNRVASLYANGLDKPTISVSVDWLELSKSTQYAQQYQNLERVFLGDTLTVEWEDYYFTTKVNSIKYDALLNRIVSFTTGSEVATLGTIINGNAIKSATVSNSNREYTKSLVEDASANATEQLTKALGGYVYKTENELYIMDTDNPTTALKVWRWNLNGLGYSSTGIGGPYTVAMTQDGQINADMITAGTIRTDRIEGYNGLTIQVGSNTQFIDNHFSFDGDGLHIIGDGSQLLIANDRITFLDDVTYITGQTLVTQNINVIESLGTVHYEFKESVDSGVTHFSLFFKGGSV